METIPMGVFGPIYEARPVRAECSHLPEGSRLRDGGRLPGECRRYPYVRAVSRKTGKSRKRFRTRRLKTVDRV